ncbi:MAG TPA: sigma-70 family RNA polymerase sigma factor [Acidobacteriota bacterium]|nr:sigma-70 family RNA polymerase sigma factor [Acidobacteriota bacterium]
MEAIDTAAVDLARSGDQDAFRDLVERHSRRVFVLAYRITGNEYDAEEVVQETFLKVHRKLKRFQSRSRFSTWLHRIAVNCAYDLLRRRRRHVDGRQEPEEHLAGRHQEWESGRPSAEQVLLSQEASDRVKKALGLLTPQERAAFVLRHFEGLSSSEIADRLGVGKSAAKHAVFRAVQKLRGRLRSYAGGLS